MGLLATTRPRLSNDELEQRSDELVDVSSTRAGPSHNPTRARCHSDCRASTSFCSTLGRARRGPNLAFANAGISLGGGTLEHGGVTRVVGGVLFAKLFGKFLGVAGATLLASVSESDACRKGWDDGRFSGSLQSTGIGLTVSFLVADLAFADSVRQNQAKLAVLVAAVISAVVSAVILRTQDRLVCP